MNIRKLLLPGLIAAVLVAPVALAQVSVGAKGGTAIGAQVGPVGAAKAQVGVDVKVHSDAVHDAVDTAREAGDKVGETVKATARTGAQAADKASGQAATAISGNAKAEANAAVTNGADEPEEDDGN